MRAKTKTFKEIYDALDNVSPKTKWVQRIAKETMRSENAVRMWLNGRQTPEPLVQNIIARELGVPVEGLFPINKKNDQALWTEEE